MKNRLMTSIAITALLAGTGVALAQAGGAKEAPSSGMSTQSPATPHSDSGSSGTMNKNRPQESTGETQKNPARTTGQAPTERHERSGAEKSNERSGAEKNHERSGAEKSHERSGAEKSNERNTGSARDNNKNTQRQNNQTEKGADHTNSQQRGDDATRSGNRSQTSGQAGGAAKLSTEQRTKITSVIRDQRVQPETNVNFNISVGTRVPRSVHFHPLPSEIVTIYPDWRGYEFFLVREQIVVVNPHTMEIVAVLEA